MEKLQSGKETLQNVHIVHIVHSPNSPGTLLQRFQVWKPHLMDGGYGVDQATFFHFPPSHGICCTTHFPLSKLN